jgi:hypothetical protein
LTLAVVAVCMTAGFAAARQGIEAPQPWAAGHCYRATVVHGEEQHTLRVLEPPRGDWVRVVSDPMSPRVPGATGRTPVWLNTASVFTLQEVDCAVFPRE